eukprot:CFRG6607T1
MTHSISACDLKYRDAITKLNSLQTRALDIKKGKPKVYNDSILQAMRVYLERIGLPLDRLRDMNAIHVSGTKGKGSTCTFSESILRSNGYKTGLYTSPHLVEVRERIKINGKPLSREMFAKYFFECWEPLLRNNSAEITMPTYFQFLTLMAYHTFLTENVDVAIVECGVGGLYDSTNVLPKPTVCAVSSLGIDHVNVLGNTITDVARHKAGIFKNGVPAVTTDQSKEALAVLCDYANKVGTPLTRAMPLKDYNLKEIPVLGLSGEHQTWNAALALAVTNQWMQCVAKNNVPVYDSSTTGCVGPSSVLTPETLKGLRDSSFPGRAMTYRSGDVTYFLDGAHTAESMQREAFTLLKPVLAMHKKRPFDAVLFCPNITTHTQKHADTTNINVSEEERLETPKLHAQVWKEMCTGAGVDVCASTSNCKQFVSIEAVVDWVESQAAEKKDSTQLQVFVCGSLHLVGGLLANLDYQI